MRCPHCAHDNPEGNRFCGDCGNLLPASRPRSSAQPSTPDPVAPVSTADDSAAPHPLVAGNRPVPVESGISGPSFLGLSNAPAPTGYEYLLEDEPQSSPIAKVLSLVLLTAAVIVVLTQWSSLKQWAIDLRTRTQPQMATTSPAPEKPAPLPPAPQAPAASAESSPANSTPEAGTAQAASPPSATAPDNSASESDSAPATKTRDAESKRDAGSKKADEKTQRATKPTANEDVDSPEEESKAALPDDRNDPLLLSGERYLYGRGGARNCGQALVNFQAAAERGNARALSHLGAMYATGNCVPLNRGRAYSFFSRALALDRRNSSLEHNLSMLWREMSPQERDQVTRANR